MRIYWNRIHDRGVRIVEKLRVEDGITLIDMLVLRINDPEIT
jgi:hypothetical protein